MLVFTMAACLGSLSLSIHFEVIIQIDKLASWRVFASLVVKEALKCKPLMHGMQSRHSESITAEKYSVTAVTHRADMMPLLML